jgi:hypothetical protein
MQMVQLPSHWLVQPMITFRQLAIGLLTLFKSIFIRTQLCFIHYSMAAVLPLQAHWPSFFFSSLQESMMQSTKTMQIKSNQIKSNQIKSNQIKK